jgi:hypothetical protein
MQRVLNVARRVPTSSGARAQKAHLSVAARETQYVFPREREGNIYAVNWSLVDHGVVAVGDAFRNAHNATLERKLGAKVDGGKVNVQTPAFAGKYAVSEAGDEITHQQFSDLLVAQNDFLSAGGDIFIEDASVGSAAHVRMGVRVVTDSPAVAMVARNMLIPSPAYELDHRARFNGWNQDPRWQSSVLEGHFDENDVFVDVNAPHQTSAGQRPIVVRVGGVGAHAAVQFVEVNKAIAGADVCIGSHAPLRALIDAIALAAVGTLNVQHADCLAVPSCAMVKDGKSTLVVNADDSIVDAAQANGSLYGAYAIALSPSGMSSLFNGYIGAVPAQASINKFAAAYVVNGGLTAVPLQPDNMAALPQSIVFFEAGAAKKALTAEEAVSRFIDLTDETKKAVIEAFVKGAKCSVAGSAKDL